MNRSTPRSPGSIRRSLALLAASALTISLAACSSAGSGTDAAADERPVVLATFTVLADIAENVAGDHLRVESITKVGAEIHGYEPTPGTFERPPKPTSFLTTG